MMIHDMNDPSRLRVLIENKFWADLTNKQPVGYLKRLPEDVDSGLLFIVPSDRVAQLWNELKRRCHDKGLYLGQDVQRNQVRWVPVGTGTKALLISDWQNVLSTLEGAADGEEIRCDIFQFRRLVERLEGLEVFLPLCEEEKGDVSVPQRIINYMDLLNSICYRLPDAMGITHGNPATYHPCRSILHRALYQDGRNIGWLSIPLCVWDRSGGMTPLWWWMAPGYTPDEGVFDVIENQLEGVYVSNVMGPVQDGNKFIPIRLAPGVEREQAVTDAIQRIRDIRARFV